MSTRLGKLGEVGQTFALTRERIRQIEAKALGKLRQPSCSRKLRAFNAPREINSRLPLRLKLAARLRMAAHSDSKAVLLRARLRQGATAGTPSVHETR